MVKRLLVAILLSLVLLSGCAGQAPPPVTVTVTAPAAGLSADDFYNKMSGSTSGVPTAVPAKPAPLKTTPVPAPAPPSSVAVPVTTPATIAPPTPAQPTAVDTVYITNTGSKYHRAGCRYLSASSIPIERADAITRGYGPCSICKP